jgi:hypothetical protein
MHVNAYPTLFYIEIRISNMSLAANFGDVAAKLGDQIEQ